LGELIPHFKETIKSSFPQQIPALKVQFLTFISNLKPHLDFLTSKTIESYHVSINTLTTIVEKLQKSATPFIKVQNKL
jgi:hypothetical protein